MEESKAAEYYEELTRKGEGAARFKQGLGFASNRDSDVPARGSALPSSSSSFLSSFVKASSPSKTSQFERESQLKSIHDKLRKKPDLEPTSARVSDKRNGGRDGRIDLSSRRRSRSRDRDLRRRRRFVSRDRNRDRDGEKRGRDRDRDRRGRSRSGSDENRKRRRERSRSRREKEVKDSEMPKSEKVDFCKVIEGYEKMTPAERVKAKMKFQLAETAEKDAIKGMGSGWERFEFDKDAPLDDDDDTEAVEDDAALVKHIRQTFRYSAVEARRTEEIMAAHDEAMFGGASAIPYNISDDDTEAEDKVFRVEHSDPDASLLSEKVLVKEKGSWRDRVRKS